MKMNLKTISSKEFDRRLEERKFEDLEMIEFVEKKLKKERGYVIKKPKKGEEVILLASGGLDSTVAWGWLLDLGVRVFPLYIRSDRGFRKTGGQKSVEFFDEYFRERYGVLSCDLQVFHGSARAREVESFAKNIKKIKPEILIDSVVNVFSGNPFGRAVWAYAPFLYAIQYIKLLKARNDLKIVKVFTGITAHDGEELPSQSFTALRQAMWVGRLLNDQNDFQLIAPFMEREWESWMEKREIVKLGGELGLSLERSWSCYGQKNKKHCGKCSSCAGRRVGFEQASLVDKTSYVG